MSQTNPNCQSRFVIPGLCLITMIATAGCVHNGGRWFGRSANAVMLTTFSSADESLASRTINHSFEVKEGKTLRLLNLAGTITLKMGKGDSVEVEAKIYAEGDNDQQTEKLLQGMEWTTITGHGDKVYQFLSYPFDDYEAFHYPGIKSGQSMNTIGDLKMRVTDERSPDTPTLFADLEITYPESALLDFSNIVGNVFGGKLRGNLSIDTGSGVIELETFDGNLDIDTGSGDIILGDVTGELSADTGSGDIDIDSIKGNSSIDTGSGDIEVHRVVADQLDADTGSGDITIHDGQIGEVSLDSGSGSITLDEVEFKSLDADTGSGNIKIISSLENTSRIDSDSGSGSLTILAGHDASFRLSVDVISGSVIIGYDDATIRRNHNRITGAKRGDGKTVINFDSPSGDCIIKPREAKE